MIRRFTADMILGVVGRLCYNHKQSNTKAKQSWTLVKGEATLSIKCLQYWYVETKIVLIKVSTNFNGLLWWMYSCNQNQFLVGTEPVKSAVKCVDIFVMITEPGKLFLRPKHTILTKTETRQAETSHHLAVVVCRSTSVCLLLQRFTNCHLYHFSLPSSRHFVAGGLIHNCRSHSIPDSDARGPANKRRNQNAVVWFSRKPRQYTAYNSNAAPVGWLSLLLSVRK